MKPNELLGFEKRIRTFAIIADIFRALIIALSVLVIIGVNAAWLRHKDFSQIFGILAWLGFAIMLLVGLGLKKSGFVRKVFNRNPQLSDAIELAKGDAPVNRNAFWDIHLKQLNEGVTKKLNWFDIFEPSDKIIAILSIIAIVLAFSFPKQIANALTPPKNEIANNISILVRPPEYTKQSEFNLGSEKHYEIAVNSQIQISVFDAGNPPKITFEGQKIASNNGNGKSEGQFVVKKSGILKVKTKNGLFKTKIKIKHDSPPKISSFGGIVEYRGSIPIVEISAKDDYAIARLIVLLDGRADGRIINEAIEIPISEGVEIKGQMQIDVAKSALIGQIAKARILIIDNAGNETQTRVFSLKLIEPEFATPLARALNEIRLDVLRETLPYKSGPNQKFRLYDAERGQENIIDAVTPIDLAPPKIQSAFNALLQFSLYPQAAGLDESKTVAIEYILTNLESAENLTEAKKVADLLWEMIETERNPTPNTQSLIAQKIEELKNALRNNASEEEIDAIKRELQNAINQHVRETAQNQEQSGDMEIEDNSGTESESISRALDNINSKSDPNEASAQLDALNQMMQNLKITQNGEQSGGGQDYLQSQKEILDETLSSDETKNLAAKQEALARDLMQSNQGKNQDLESAKNAMEEAAEALKQNNRENAIEAQKHAIEALLKAQNNQQSPIDPMGRPDESQKPGQGQAQGENENIIKNNEESKSRSIMQKLRELLGMPDKSEKEKKYYEDLMRME